MKMIKCVCFFGILAETRCTLKGCLLLFGVWQMTSTSRGFEDELKWIDDRAETVSKCG